MDEPLATVGDVEIRLGREVTGDELARVEILIIDASAIVRAYVVCPLPIPTPPAVAGVVATIVVRALARAGADEPIPIGHMQQTSGPFSTSYSEDVASGDVAWLTKMDKLILSRYRCADGVSVPMVSERTDTTVITEDW